MDPKVLADTLVEAGILVQDETKAYWMPVNERMRQGICNFPEEAVTDWRVAGKVLESLTVETLSIVLWAAVTTPGEPLPRAIIEAWYEATEQGESDER